MSCCCGHCAHHHQSHCSPTSDYYPREDFYDQPGPRRRRRRGRGPEEFQDSMQEDSYDEPGRGRGRGRGQGQGRDPEELEQILQHLQEEIERVRQDIAAVREATPEGES